MEASSWAPLWLELFWNSTYFTPCQTHVHVMTAKGKKTEASAKKSEKNMFCIDCNEGPLCRTGKFDDHKGHHYLQVRKASQSFAIQIADIERWVDITSIHKYVINGERIVFLPSRPQEKQVKQYHCEECGRGLDSNDRFCSIGCKWKTKQRHPTDASINLIVPSFEREGNGGGEMAGPASPNPKQAGKKRARSSSAQQAYTALQQSSPVERTGMTVNLKTRRERAPDLTGMMGQVMIVSSSPKKQSCDVRDFAGSFDNRHPMSPESLQHPATPDRYEKPRNRRKGIPSRSPMF